MGARRKRGLVLCTHKQLLWEPCKDIGGVRLQEGVALQRHLVAELNL